MKNKTGGFRYCLNAVNDEAEVTCSGSVFQMQAPATGKAREPMEVRQTAGTIRPSVVEDRSLYSEKECQRHGGIAADTVVRRRSEHGMGSATLYVMHSGTRNQCKLTRASVMWSERRSRNIRRAAAFWTDWRRR